MGWINCATCKELFGLTNETEAILRRSGQDFRCPWGHISVFSKGKSDTEILQEKLNAETRERQRLEQRIAQVRDEAEGERRKAAAYKGQATRLRRRASAGTCPCCNRTFQQLARHMATKHPKFEPVLIEGGKVA